MSFTFENYKKAIKFTCKGNASRSEYWSFVGLSIIFAVVSAAICAGLGRIVPKIIEDFWASAFLFLLLFLPLLISLLWLGDYMMPGSPDSLPLFSMWQRLRSG